MRTFIKPLTLLVLAIATLPAAAQDGGYKLDERENVGPEVNSPGIELLPIISPDGRTLYFDRKNDLANTGGIRDDDDIYFSELQPDGIWSPARNVGPPLNTPGSDVLFWISPDGERALVYNGAVINGKTVGLAITHRQNGMWGTPIPIDIEGLDDLGDIFYAHVSIDGRRLFLAYAPDENNPENLDIYCASARGTDMIHWGRPVPLGSNINTDQFEGSPFLASDNRTLYFISKGHTSYGLTDVFYSRRMDENWTVWSTPVNLGGSINTPQYEASLSIDARGEYVYVSGDGDYGEVNFGTSDIYRIKLVDSLRPQPATIINGHLTARGNGVQGLVRVESMPDHRELSSAGSDDDGKFMLVLPAGGHYRLTGWAQGYNETTRMIDTNRPGQLDITLSLSGTGRQEPARDAASSMFAIPPPPTVQFAFASAKLTDSAEVALRQALEAYHAAIEVGRDITIHLSGHADSIGSADRNMELSRHRAASVKAWLVAHGIEEDRITTEGHGATMPVADNSTDAGRARNRRVETTVDGVMIQRGATVTPRSR